MFAIAVYVLYRDFSLEKVKMHNMFLCHLRAYLPHISFCALVHSFVIQAFHRLAGIVYFIPLPLILIQYCVIAMYSRREKHLLITILEYSYHN
jgi:hypothetical protein